MYLSLYIRVFIHTSLYTYECSTETINNKVDVLYMHRLGPDELNSRQFVNDVIIV